MADRVLHVSWGEVVRGREERALEVFNESLGFYGRMQQEGRIESFDVVLLEPSNGVGGYVEVHGSAEALAALTEDDDWRQLIADTGLIVDDLRIARGLANEGVAEGIARFQAAIAKVPQRA
jgi:hypothetical protein